MQKLPVKYDLSHLTGPANQAVLGPIQDDEALFIYSIVRGMRINRVLELGGLSGYSALNFIKAMEPGGVVYSVDINPLTAVSKNHVCIHKDAKELTADDIGGLPIELIFFDIHDYDIQMGVFQTLLDADIITDSTLIILHDTNVHPYKVIDSAYTLDGRGWIHRPEERSMVNTFVEQGYQCFSLHPDLSKHNKSFPYRHGVSVLQKFKTLVV
jgi:predicted O-methyltransferase YrrM